MIGFYFDQAGCIACRACQIACKDRHDLPVGVSYLRLVTRERGRFPRPEVFHLALACFHCARPACVEACASGGLYKRADGLVMLDADLCVGCRACEAACPYGAPQWDEAAGRIGKCDLCADLLARGEEPACVAACPMEALRVGPVESLPGEVPRGRDLPDPDLTGPALRIDFHRHGREG